MIPINPTPIEPAPCVAVLLDLDGTLLDTRQPGSQLFPGVSHMLSGLTQTQVPWGVVTNRSTAGVRQVLLQCPFLRACPVWVCGDTLPQRKPQPEPLWYAEQALEAEQALTFFVGDTESDMQAARAAGMVAVWAHFGQISPWGQPDRVDHVLACPEALLALVAQQGTP